jgi:hypothetical protein
MSTSHGAGSRLSQWESQSLTKRLRLAERLGYSGWLKTNYLYRRGIFGAKRI